MAYASWKAGDSAFALKLLEGRTDELSAYVLRMVNPSAVIPGAKAGVKEAQPFFIKTTYKSGSLSLGVLPKSVENIALQRAFYAIMPEPTVKEMGFFKDKVLAFPEAYFLGGEVYLGGRRRGNIHGIADVGKVRDVVAVSKLGDTDARRRSYEEGFDLSRKEFIREIEGRGYVVEDLGRGDFYALGEKAGRVAYRDRGVRGAEGVRRSPRQQIQKHRSPGNADCI